MVTRWLGGGRRFNASKTVRQFFSSLPAQYHGTVSLGTTLSFSLNTRTLDNGLLVTASHDPLAPGAAVNLWYGVGSADDPSGAAGFAHLFEHLMFAGSANVPDGQHTLMLEALGGLANATTSPDRTNYFETVPAGALDLALWLEADRLASLAVSGKALATQRAVVHEEKRQRYDNPPYGDQLALMLAQVFPPCHPYATPAIGSMTDLDAASLEDVLAFHATWYRPDNASLVVVSPLDDDQVFRSAERYLGAVPAPDNPPARRANLTPLPQMTMLSRRRASRPVPRSVLHLMWRTPPLTHPLRPAVSLAFDVLASGPTSRLHRDLVRDQGLAQSVGASDFGLTRGTSLGAISAPPAAGRNLEPLEEAIVDHITALAADGPTPAELERAKAQLERDWFAGLAGASDRADAINESIVEWGDAAFVNNQLENWLAVTPDDVATAAGTWLNPANRGVLEYLAEQEMAA